MTGERLTAAEVASKRPTCASCKFLDTFGLVAPWGQCRKAPPAIDSASDERMGVWPLVNGDADWCGEHEHDDRLRTPGVVG